MSYQQIADDAVPRPTKPSRSNSLHGHINFKVDVILLFRAFLSTVVCAIFAVVLKVYDDRSSFSRTQKNVMQTIITALSLALGINFIVSTKSTVIALTKFKLFKGSFKGLANVVRWRILKSGSFSGHQSELILELESFWNVIKLGVSRAGPAVTMFCLLWVSLHAKLEIRLCICIY